MKKKLIQQKGLKRLKMIGESGATAITELGKIYPALARYSLEFTCGEIYSRRGLTAKTREMVAIAALTVLGNALPQLKIHVEGGLRNGCSKKEIKEIILQMVVYAGFPAVFNAIKVAHEVFCQFETQKN